MDFFWLVINNCTWCERRILAGWIYKTTEGQEFFITEFHCLLSVPISRTNN